MGARKRRIPPRLRWSELEEGIAILSFEIAAPRRKVAGESSTRRKGASVLTPAQHKVAMLAVRGRSNAEIAKRLGIAVRTVANHMAAVLARTGAASRFELARKIGG